MTLLNRAMCLTLNVIGSCLCHNQLQHCAIFVIQFLLYYNCMIILLFYTTAYLFTLANLKVNLGTKSIFSVRIFCLKSFLSLVFQTFLQLGTLAHCSGVCDWECSSMAADGSLCAGVISWAERQMILNPLRDDARMPDGHSNNVIYKLHQRQLGSEQD